MRESSQTGNTLLNVIGVIFASIAAIVVLSVWYYHAWHYKKISEITTFMGAFLQKYHEGIPGLAQQKAQILGPIVLKNYGLINQCDEGISMFTNQKVICKLPLGELDVTTEYKDNYLNSYVYVHFNDIYKSRSCEQFLSVGWQNIVPKDFFGNRGYIGIISENTHGKIYYSNDSANLENGSPQRNPTRGYTKEVCALCKNSRYCTIQFFSEYSDKVIFPSELMGENGEGEENEDEGEVTEEDDNTYIKTNGDFTEVVTYSDGGVFSGATFSGGSLSSVYEGTYTRQGITSYTSYKDASKQQVLNKVDNITYGQNGISSYEKDSKKFLLIGTSKDCLITDETGRNKRFGHCEKPLQEETSLISLDYNEQGLLQKISGENNNTLYTFLYDSVTNKLIGYCDVSTSTCHDVTDGQTLNDIVQRDIPDTIGRFNSLYQHNGVDETDQSRSQKPKFRSLTKEEALKYVKESGNIVRVKFK